MKHISKKIQFLSTVIILTSGFHLLPINDNRVVAIPTAQLVSSDRGNNNYTGILETVNNIAEQISVRITTPDNPSHGSGVIVAKQGNTYYVATVKHNFSGDISSYQIVTSDGANHQLDLTTLEKSDTYDLAIFSFDSSNNYSVATIGNYNTGNEFIFATGFPNKDDNKPEMMITGGRLTLGEARTLLVKETYSLSSNRQEKQNTLAYTNISHRGMSGGAILDSQGRLIGIHTSAENEIDDNTSNQFNIGLSLGQSVTGLIDYLKKNQTPLNTAWLNITENPAPRLSNLEVDSIFSQLATIQRPNSNSNAVDWMNYGNQMWRYYRYTDAVDAFKKAIELNPDLHQAYYAMGKTYLYPQKYREAIYALTTATNKNPDIYYYWRWLGYAYSQLKEYDKQALEAYKKAIDIKEQDPDPILYLQRGHLHFSAQRYPKALTDYEKVTEINPEYSVGYLNQGTTYTCSGLQKLEPRLAKIHVFGSD